MPHPVLGENLSKVKKDLTLHIEMATKIFPNRINKKNTKKDKISELQGRQNYFRSFRQKDTLLKKEKEKKNQTYRKSLTRASDSLQMSYLLT